MPPVKESRDAEAIYNAGENGEAKREICRQIVRVEDATFKTMCRASRRLARSHQQGLTGIFLHTRDRLQIQARNDYGQDGSKIGGSRRLNASSGTDKPAEGYRIQEVTDTRNGDER